MDQTEIFQNMTKGEWSEEPHNASFLTANNIGIARFYDRMDDDYPNTRANICAVISAVNNTYGKGVNPESVEKMIACLDDIRSKTYSTNDGNYRSDFTADLFKKIDEALTAAKLENA